MIPFLIVGMPRTGSTLLHTGLAQHPQARLYSELFHPLRSQRMAGHAIRRNGADIFFDETGDDAIRFLDEHVFRADEQRAAVGVKIFAEHVRCAGTERLFARLKAHYPALRVLHVLRRDYLAVLVSREMANRTGEWVRTAPVARPPLPRIAIRPAEAANFFQAMKLADGFFAGFFAGSGYRAIRYEDLSTDFAATMSGAFEFLGLAPAPVEIRVLKQIGEPARRLVENFDELKAYFAGGEFAGLFGGGTNPLIAFRPSVEIETMCKFE